MRSRVSFGALRSRLKVVSLRLHYFTIFALMRSACVRLANESATSALRECDQSIEVHGKQDETRFSRAAALLARAPA